MEKDYYGSDGDHTGFYSGIRPPRSRLITLRAVDLMAKQHSRKVGFIASGKTGFSDLSSLIALFSRKNLK